MGIPSSWYIPLDKRKAKLTIFDTVLFGVLGALTFAAKYVMSPLPNIEPVSLMVMLFAVAFRWKGLYPTYIYVVMEVLFYGINLWNVYYLYIWAVLFLAAIAMRKVRNPFAWAALSGAFGLLFGALCAIVNAFIGGVGYAVAWWMSGISFDIIHSASNFVIALLLFVPLRNLLEKLYTRIRK